MPKSLEQRRIEALEETLLEYVGLYDPTELAKRAFSISAPSKIIAPQKPLKHSEGKGESTA
jgi:hypothetical protein